MNWKPPVVLWYKNYFDDLVQDWSISIASELEIHTAVLYFTIDLSPMPSHTLHSSSQ